MKTIIIEAGFDAKRFPTLGGHIYLNSNFKSEEIAIVISGFSRVATNEVFLKCIAEKLQIPAVVFDWHGLGLSSGNFGDVTVERLLLDLKRVTGYLMSKGFFKFHLIGHSLGACVIALAMKDPVFSLGKKLLLAPALNQEYLMRYWYGKSRGHDLTHVIWLAYNDEEFRSKMKAEKNEQIFDKLWPYEKDFQIFCGESKNVKGQLIKSEYWQAEKNQDYTNCLPFNKMFEMVIDSEDILCVYGDMDMVVPWELIECSFADPRIIEEADHYFLGHEEEVAKIASEFIC